MPSDGCSLVAPLIERLAILLDELLGFARGQHAVGQQALGIERAHRRVLADRAVHERLRRRRLVGFVVAEPPIADQVDHARPCGNSADSASAKRVAKITASGSSALTCRIGASIILATSLQ